jgi:hypothetical protein
VTHQRLQLLQLDKPRVRAPAGHWPGYVLLKLSAFVVSESSAFVPCHMAWWLLAQHVPALHTLYKILSSGSRLVKEMT